ncbi:MAG: serine hydrolase domain-containing protein [Bacteroidota bacterium]
MKSALSIILSVFVLSLWGQTTIPQSIDAILSRAVATETGPGMTVGVVKDGQLIYHNSRGNMNLEYELPFNDSTKFDLASVTKQFTATCIGILAKEELLSVKDDVRKYIPELAFYGDTIRIKHLLNHTSGIRNHNVLLDLQGFDFDHRSYTNSMIEGLMFRQRGVNNAPGEKMLYSNTNYVLLALVIERVSGSSIQEFAESEIFTPLKMTNTFYIRESESVIKNRAYPHYRSGSIYKQPKSLNPCVGAGGMISTIADLAKWSLVFTDSDHRLSYLKDFITQLDTLNDGEHMKHARGMFVSPYQGYNTFNHSGRGLGMRSQFICVPDLNLSVIVFSNSEHLDAVDVSYQIIDLYLEDTQGDEIEILPQRSSAPNLLQLVGSYQELNSDMRMEILVENDTLKALSSFGQTPVPLVSLSETVFARLDSDAVRYSFSNSTHAGADLQVDFGGAIFYFENIELEEHPNQDLEDYVGEYYSTELEVTYSITMSDDQLMLSYPNNIGLALREGVHDTFGANRRTKYTFNRNTEQEVISFEVASEGTVKGILFERL